MPETPVAREQLLASVHTLHDGDLLLVRAPSMNRDDLNNLADAVAPQLPDGVRLLVVAGDLAIQVVRPNEQAADLTEAVARAKANPGQVVEVEP